MNVQKVLTRCMLVIMILSDLASAAERDFRLRSGVLDLRSVDFEKFSTLTVAGDAEFYWQKFIEQDGIPETRSLLEFPGAWNLVGEFPAHGFGSYRMKIRLPERMPITLRFDSFWSSSEIYVEDRLIKTRGTIGRTPDISQADLGAAWTYTFTPESSDFTIVLQISNFDLFLGGAVSGIMIGTPDAISETIASIQSRGAFLIGALFIMGIYHIALFLLRPQDLSSFYYGIFSLLVCVHVAVGDPSSPVRLLFDLSFREAILAYNCSWMMATAAFCLYTQTLFPHEYSGQFAKVVFAISAGFVLFIAFTDVRTFIVSTQFYQLVMFICIVYSVIAILRAATRRRDGAFAFVFCVAVLMVCAINDMLLIRGLINTQPVGPVGAFIFTFGQSYLLSVRFSKAFKALAASSAEILRLNESLEERVELKTRDIRAIMENVPIGIFSIRGEALQIDADYSRYLEQIMGRGDLSGNDLMSAVVKDFNLSSDHKSSIQNALSASMEEDRLAFDLNSHILPSQVTALDRQLQLSWDPMMDDSGIVRKILVTMNDMTELKDLQENLKTNADELMLIGEILSIPPNTFERFMVSSRSLNQVNRQVLGTKSSPWSAGVISRIYMNLHTIKGDARTIRLRSFSDFIHEIEKPYADFEKTQPPLLNYESVQLDIEKIEQRLDLIQRVVTEKLQRKEGDHLSGSQAFDFDEVARLMMRIIPALGQNPLKNDLIRVYSDISNRFFLSFEEVLYQILEGSESVAEDLGKAKPKFSINVPSLQVGLKTQEMLRNSFVHLIRNSLDHGIEDPEGRIASGKSPSGCISIEAEVLGNDLVIRLYDDGRGLNIVRLRQLAASRGVVMGSDLLSVMDLIFLDRISTSEKVTSISGRGIGMSAVRKFVEAVGGEISAVPTAQDTGAKFLPFQFRIVLPLTLFFPSSDQVDLAVG